MLALLVTSAFLAGPLSADEALGLLKVDSFTARSGDRACKDRQQLLARGTAAEAYERRAELARAICFDTKYTKVAAILQAKAAVCNNVDDCASWLVFARAAVLDGSSDFATGLMALVASSLGDTVEPSVVQASLERLDRAAQAQPKNRPLQRFTFLTWLKLANHISTWPELGERFTRATVRALEASSNDFDLPATVVSAATMMGSTDLALQYVDTMRNIPGLTPPQQALVAHIESCIAIKRNDTAAASASIAKAAKLDPFDKRIADTKRALASGATEKGCQLEVSLFTPSLQSAVLP